MIGPRGRRHEAVRQVALVTGAGRGIGFGRTGPAAVEGGGRDRFSGHRFSNAEAVARGSPPNWLDHTFGRLRPGRSTKTGKRGVSDVVGADGSSDSAPVDVVIPTRGIGATRKDATRGRPGPVVCGGARCRRSTCSGVWRYRSRPRCPHVIEGRGHIVVDLVELRVGQRRDPRGAPYAISKAGVRAASAGRWPGRAATDREGGQATVAPLSGLSDTDMLRRRVSPTRVMEWLRGS